MRLRRAFRVRSLILLSTAAYIIAAAFGVSTILAPSPASAAQSIPYKVNFQGRLTDNSGNALSDGLYNMTFRLFTAPSGGTNQWQADRVRGAADNRVQVTNGLFNIQFGDTTLGDPALSPSLFNTGTGTLYLEVELPTPATATCATNGCAVFTEGAMTPRQPLASSPYAFNSDTLDGLDSASFGQLSAVQSWTDTNTFSKTGGAAIVLAGSAATGGSILQIGSALSGGSASGTLFGANTSAAGDLLNLQVSNVSKLKVDAAGNLTAGGDVALAAGANRNLSVGPATSGAGNNLTITAGQSGTGAVNGGDLVLQAGATGGSGTSGSVKILVNGVDTSTAFQVQNAAAAPAFSIDTVANKVVVGDATGTDAATSLLVVDTAVSDPTTGYNGAMYYNSSTQKFRCYENNAWADCISANAAKVFGAYDATGGANIGTGITVDLDTIRKNSDPSVFSLASGELTINDTGTYIFQFRLGATLTAGTRGATLTYLERDTGAGFIEVPGTRAYAYGRITTYPEATAVAFLASDVASGDKFRIHAETQAGTFSTVADGSSMVVYKATAGGTGTAGSGATTALDNLTATAINQALVADLNNTRDLGSAGIAWRNGYFGTSIRSPLYTGSGAVTLSSGGTSDLTLDSASGILQIAASDTALQRNAAGTYGIDLSDAADTTLSVGNSGAGVANLTVDGGLSIGAGQTYQINGTQISSADLSNDAAITKQGNTFNGNSQLIQTTAGGALPVLSGANLTNLDPSSLVQGTGGVTLQSAAGTTLAIDSGTTGAINIGTGASAKTITIGNATGASGVNILAGTGNLAVGTPDATSTQLILDSGTSDPTGVDGGMYYNSASGKFRCFQASAWQDCGGSTVTATANSFASITSGLANVPANVTGTPVETLIFTSATAVSNTAGATGFKAPASGSFRTCLIKNNANITAGTLSVRWRVNGVSAGSPVCTMDSTVANRRDAASSLDTGLVTFAAGDTIGIAFDTSATYAPVTTDYTVYWSVEYNASSGNGLTLQFIYDSSSAPAAISLTNNKSLTVNAADTATDSSVVFDLQCSTCSANGGRFAVQNSGTDAFVVNPNNGGIALNQSTTLAAGSNLTLAAGSGVLSQTFSSGTGGSSGQVLGISNTNTAAGVSVQGSTFTPTNTATPSSGSNTINLVNFAAGSSSGSNITNGINFASVTGYTNFINSPNFKLNASGDLTSAFTALNGTSTANGAGAASTALILASAANFDIGNYVQVNSANCGGAGVNPCYAKITNKVTNTLTITPALSWANGSTVNEFHVPEIGATNTASTLANRFGRGYFIAGVAAGNGTTFYNEDSIESTLATFDLLATNVATLNIGTAATSITLGTTGTAVSIPGSLSVTGNITAPSTGTSGYLSRAGTTLSPSNAGDNFTTSGNISTTGTGTITAAGGVDIATGQTYKINGTQVSSAILSNDANLTKQGNTFNGVTQLVQTTGTGALPALNAGALTNLTSANLTGALPALNGSALTNLTAGNLTGTLPALSGANLTNLNPTNLATGSGAVTLQAAAAAAITITANAASTWSTTAGNLTLNSGGGTLVLGAATTTLQKSATAFTVDLNNAAASTLTITNAAAGVASLAVEGNVSIGAGQTYQVNGTQISSANLSNDAAITKQGNTFNGNSQLVQTTAGGAYPALSGAAITNLTSGNLVGALPAISGASLTNLNPTNLATGSGAVALQSAAATALTLTSNAAATWSTTAGNLTLDAGSGTIAFGAATTTLQKSGTALTIDLNNAAASTLTVTNAGAGTASLVVEGGVSIGAGQTYKVNGTQISSADLSNDAAITKQGNTFNGATQLIQTTAGGAYPALSGANITAINASNIAQGSGAVTLQSAAATAMTFTANAASIWSTSAGQLTVQSGSGTLSFGSTTALTSTGALNIDSGTVNALNIGAGANAKTVTLGNTTGGTTLNLNSGTGGINLGDTANTKTIDIGGVTNSGTDTINIATNGTLPDALNIGNNASGTRVIINGGPSTTTSGTNGVIIGSATADATQVNLQLDSSSAFSETASTCSSTVNQGAMYYNTAANVMRACVNGAWEDLVSTAGLGLQLYGVVPDSGTNPGDLAAVTGNQNGPCKVSVGAALTTVSWSACTAYSGGRKVIVTAGTATTTNGVAGNYQHLCLTGANSQPALSTAGAITANLATVSMPSVNSPILCLADIRFNGANNTITQIYDARTYTITDKIPVTVSTTAPALGHLVQFTAAKGVVTPMATLNGNNLAGVLVATTGATSTTTVNAIMAVGGPVAVKAITGTNVVGAYIFGSATAGFATTVATKPAEATNTIYNLIGNARTAWTGAAACAVNNDSCAGSILTYIDKR